MPSDSAAIGPDRAAKLARAERLPLDIVPAVADGKLNLEVLYQGKPSASSEVIVIDPAGKEKELKTDAEGKVAVAAPESGRYAVRAAHLETDKSGTRGDKKYAQTWHYCTLLVDVTGAPPRPIAPRRPTCSSGLATRGPSGTTSPGTRPT